MKPNKKTIKVLIHKLLEDREYLRDNDESLSANIIYLFLDKRGFNVKKMSAFDLLNMYAKNELPTIDYITRVRRKLQEDNPELRGKNYKARQNKAEEITKQINKDEIDEIL